MSEGEEIFTVGVVAPSAGAESLIVVDGYVAGIGAT